MNFNEEIVCNYLGKMPKLKHLAFTSVKLSEDFFFYMAKCLNDLNFDKVEFLDTSYVQLKDLSRVR